MSLTEAIDILSRWAMHLAVEAWSQEGWENHFPDVGLYDYERISERMEGLLPPDVSLESFEKAYALLADRAEGVV